MAEYVTDAAINAQLNRRSASKKGLLHKYSFAWVFKYFFAKDRTWMDNNLSLMMPDVEMYSEDILMSQAGRCNLRREIWTRIRKDLLSSASLIMFKKLCDLMTV